MRGVGLANTEQPHLRYVAQFEEAEQASIIARKESERARDYKDGKQFTAEEEATLRKRKQPITPENLIRPKVEGLCGLERQSRTDPKAWPRTQADDDDATAATDALRYVHDDQDFAVKKSRVFEHMLVEGFGGVEVGVARTRSGIDPTIICIAWDRLYHDPHSCEADFSDASYLGYVTWMDFDQAREKWPDRIDIIDSTINAPVSSTGTDTFDDKPKFSHWSDAKRKRVRINTHYHLRGGVWHRCVFTLGGELEDSAPSPFIDDQGKPECPLILQSAYVDRDNHRYGIVRDMIPLQDEVNKRRSKFLHIVNNRQVRVDPATGQDANAVRRELARPDGVVVGGQGEIEILPLGDMAMGQFQLLADTRQSLKGIGPNANLQGKGGDAQSGRAILAQQQAGMTEMTPLLDNLRHFTLRVYRQVWNRIRQYWTGERWVRVTDDEKNVRFVGLNVTQGHLAMQKIDEAVRAGKLPPDVAQQYAQQIRFDPQMQQPANTVAELDVDIEIDEVNETPSLAAEQFEALTNLVPLFGSPPPPEIVELIIAASNFRDKEKLIEIVEKMKEAAMQPNPMQQLQQAAGQAAVEETRSKTMLNVAKAHETGARPLIESFKAGAQSVPGAMPMDAGNTQTAVAKLEAAIARHERHMDGTEPTSDASQMKMMDEMKAALAALKGKTRKMAM